MNKLSLIAKGEEKLVQEINEIIDSGNNISTASRKGISPQLVKAVINDFNKAEAMPHVEAVVVPFMRPVLFIKNGKIEIPESLELKERILKFKPVIEQPLSSVGRIELKNHQIRNLGTGWIVSENVIVTNRHVAEFFAIKENRNALGAAIRRNFTGDILKPNIDFQEEYINASTSLNEFEIEIEKVLYLPDGSKDLPDIALLKLRKNRNLPSPVPFVNNKLKADQLIGIVGYPMQDPRGVVDKDMEQRIFGNVFGVKRYAPGQIIDVPANKWYFLHDASTLGGNSGSLVQDMETGCAIGIHFSGMLLEANYAVKGKEIQDILPKLGVGKIYAFSSKETEDIIMDPDFIHEKPFDIQNYISRKGFDEEFLGIGGERFKVKLPVIKNKADVVKFGTNNKESKLKYTHFTVEMSESRRMCFYSAVNIDGNQYKRIKRTGWRYDPRIPEKLQIMKECYGNAPKFSRGHMTRREDPNWGELTTAILGNDDSMHVTNTVPQMQSFNAGIWLSLENYALENTKLDRQRISVFTGPFLHESDPVKYGVKIPVEFWKVIAFIHDETGKLCATGYTMSQENYLRNEEFVFGEFQTYQTPIRVIEKKANIIFPELSEIDPLANAIFETIHSPIQSVRQIRFFNK
jgi:endonuclease G